MSRRERQRRRHRSSGGAGRIIFLGLGVLFATIAIGAISAVGYVVSIAASAPDLSELKAKDQGENSIIFAANGKKLGIIQSDVLRREVSSKSIAQTLKDATVAIEDKRFYQHEGVDFEGVVRAAIKNAESGETVQGGSTLTMQLVKNIYSQDATRDYKRKVREAKLAEELENRHPGPEGKQWILVKYVNNVPYGNSPSGQEAIGAWAAARVFFNKSPSKLTLAESALLAGLPQAPTAYNPRLNPEAALRRRNDVLAQMRDAGYITAAQESEAAAEPLGLKDTGYYSTRRESYFFDYVKGELIKTYGAQKVREGGLRVYTTIDLKKQQQARAAIKKSLSAPGSPSSALATISPKTGYIKAMASSSNYGDSKFNLAAQGRRQPGSTFKVIVVMAAIARGVDINRTSYTSKKLDFVDPTYGKIEVSNSGDTGSGARKTILEGLVSSDNTVMQQLDLDIGPPNVTKTARKMGITTKLNSYPAEALGGLETGVSPLEMARAYATLNNGGSRVKPIAVTRVRFPDGKVDKKMGKVRKFKVFTDGEAYEGIQAMKGNINRGTGTRARLASCEGAGKTGTTSGFKDAWFDGMTRDLNTAVWVGYPGSEGKVMNAVPNWGTMFGGDAPAQIWKDYMTEAVKGTNCSDWPEPKTPFVAEPFFGKYANGGAPGGSSDPGQPFNPADAYAPGIQPGGEPTNTAPSTGAAATPTPAPAPAKKSKDFPSDQYEAPPQPAPTAGGAAPVADDE
ncbi:MAG: penicillin-binding protein [Solirubrobacterales bacterium]|nr:penicillin-binding protein [Solirubrobacterales bacterium]